MLHFKKKKTINLQTFNEKEQTPVIRASICTGEQVAGFRNKETWKFEEAMLIRGEKDLQEFCIRYGVKQKEIKKEWWTESFDKKLDIVYNEDILKEKRIVYDWDI